MPSILDEFHEQFSDLGHKRGTVRGHYSIFWDGFIPAQCTHIVVGAFKAWPVVGLPLPGPRPADWVDLPYMVGVIRGRAWGTYEPGAHWDIRPPVGEKPISSEMWATPEGVAEVVAAVNAARARMIAMVEDFLAGKSIPKARTAVVVGIDPETKEIISDPAQWGEYAK